MFFCKTCETENGWPNSIFKSVGNCEMCGIYAPCNDVPSKYLPPAKPKKADIDINSIT
jgi:hypothetical protein